MTIQTMAEVAASVRGHRFQSNTDLPLPNIYWCSVDMPGMGHFHAHLASDHTKAAVHKMANFCAEHYSFRPYRSNSQMKVRRLKLGDLVENPEAHRIALENAKAAGERDVIDALERLPAWIAAHIKGLNRVIRVPRPANDSAVVWERLTLEIAGMSAASA